ncbi:MAG: PD-(D/E)XK nuclease family protein [Candidatus Dormibacteria bacterium]
MSALRPRSSAPKPGVADLLGPVRVVGGPRSGKTSLLARLVIEWLAQGGAPERAVTVVRSRDAAARFRALVGAGLSRAHPTLRVQTHEGLARGLLERLGPPSGRARLSPAGEWLAVRAALRRAAPLPRLGPVAEEPSCIDDVLSMLSACRRALVGPGLLAARLSGAPESLGEVAVLADSYQRVLDGMDAYDGRDVHLMALERLLDDRAEAQGWADLLLVDEAEDLSPAQWLLIRELGERLSPPRRLVLAGDPSESTPGFRGVSSESSSRPFVEYFPREMAPREWRLPSVLPRWTEELVEEIGLPPEGRPSTEFESGSALDQVPEAAFRLHATARIWVAADETEEALAVAREIMRARLQGEVEFGEVAILVRSPGRQLAALRMALDSLGVPYRPWGATGPGGHALVAVALNWLRVLCRPDDEAALLEALGVGPAAVPRAGLRELRRQAGRRSKPVPRFFWDWVRGFEDPGAAPPSEGHEVELLRAAGEPWLALGAGLDEWASAPLDQTRLRLLLGQVELASGIGALALDDLELATAMAGFAGVGEAVLDAQLRLGEVATTLPRWLESLQLALPRSGAAEPVVPETADQVTVMPLRQAKGRAWSKVFILGCAAGTIPAPPDTGGLLDPEELQELVRRVPELEDVLSSGESQRDAEARLFLLGLTRASSEVTCSWAHRYLGQGVERSSFIEALLRCAQIEVPAPLAELVRPDDLVQRVALSRQAARGLGELGRQALELRHALEPWDPVSEGPDPRLEPLTLSATSVATWLACPRQYLAQLLIQPGEPDVSLTLGSAAHRLLQSLQRQRSSWAGDQGAFRALAITLIRDEIMPGVRGEHPDPLEVTFIALWLTQMVARWDRQIVSRGIEQVGEPIAAEVEFAVERQGWQLRGRVDALWRHPDGSVELLDYKTSREAASAGKLRSELFGKPPQGPVQWQLPIYQLAAREGAFEAELGDQLPTRMRNWYVGVDPKQRAADPILAAGFRMTQGPDPGAAGSLTEAELGRIAQAVDQVARAILGGRFPARPGHDVRTCRDTHRGCPLQLWCDGEGSVGAAHPIPALRP